MTELVTSINSEGYLGQLTDEVIESYEAVNQTMTVIVTAMLAFQKQSPAITVGTIQPTVTRSIKIENDTILRSLLKLRATHGGHIEVDSNLALNWWNSVGEDKGQQIRYRKNLVGITRKRDYQGTCQKIFAYGAGEGDARIQLDDLLPIKETATESEDATYGYLTLGGQYSCYKGWTALGAACPAEMIVYEDDVDVTSDWHQGADEQTLRCAIADYAPASVYTATYRHATYLWDGTANPLVRQHTDRRVTHPDTLIAWARLYLTECRLPITSYEIDTIDLSTVQTGTVAYPFEELQLGSVVKVIDENLGIDVETFVVGLTNRDLQHPEDLIIELCTSTKDISDFLSEIYDTEQLNQNIATEISAGQVVVKGTFTVLDWVTSGETTIVGSNIQTGTLAADRITTGTLGAATITLNGVTSILKSSNYVADTSGWQIKGDGDAEFNNVKIRGTIYTSSIAAGNTLTITGTASFGGGTCKIDSLGLYIRSTTTNLRARIYGATDGHGLQIWADANNHVWFNCPYSDDKPFYFDEIQMASSDDDILPSASGQCWIGLSDQYFAACYIGNIYYKTHEIFQDHDDIALIRQMKAKPGENDIDPDTVPEELREDVVARKQYKRRTVAEAEQQRIGQVLQQEGLTPQGKRRMIAEIKEGSKKRLAKYEADDSWSISLNKTLGLALGASVQLADQIEKLRAEITLLKGGTP